MQAKKAGSILICAIVTVLLIILGAGNISNLNSLSTVTEVVADIPAHNFESAVTEKGSEIYYTDNNPGCIIVKEGDVYYSFGIQDNSFPSDAKGYILQSLPCHC